MLNATQSRKARGFSSSLLNQIVTPGKPGLDFEVLDSGCCGIAGAFGFEKEHYDISIKAGERVLLPTVREADREIIYQE